MQTVISLEKVTKNYGSSRGVSDLSMDIAEGSIFGFLGPNGAGKSTTINMLVDLIRPSSGVIRIFGLDSQKDSIAVRRRIGFLSGDMALDSQLTGRQQLTYFGNLRGGVSAERINGLGQTLDVDLDRKIKTLSRGNRQKIGLISALMHDPDLLIFDEPTSGLDPLIQQQFNKIVLDHKARGKSTFISSHVLSEVQEVCDQVAFIREGRIISVQDMAGIATSLPKTIRVTSSDNKLLTTLKKIPGVTVTNSETGLVDLAFLGDINNILGVLAKHDVKDVTIQEADLETIFMKYYQDDKNV